MKWHTFTCRPEKRPRIWVARKTLGQGSAPRCEPPRSRLRRFLEEHQQLLFILGIVIPCSLPLVFTAKVGMSAAHRRWLLQEQEIEEPEVAPSSPAEAVIVETREDDFQQSVRHLLRTI